jgi:hypothetical protein
LNFWGISLRIAARDLLYEIDDPMAHGWARYPRERFD